MTTRLVVLALKNKDTNVCVNHIQHLTLLMGYLETKALANRDVPGWTKPSVQVRGATDGR